MELQTVASSMSLCPQASHHLLLVTTHPPLSLHPQSLSGDQPAEQRFSGQLSLPLCVWQDTWKLNEDVKKRGMWLKGLNPNFMCLNPFNAGPEDKSSWENFQWILGEKFLPHWGSVLQIVMMDHGFQLMWSSASDYLKRLCVCVLNS